MIVKSDAALLLFCFFNSRLFTKHILQLQKINFKTKRKDITIFQIGPKIAVHTITLHLLINRLFR